MFSGITSFRGQSETQRFRYNIILRTIWKTMISGITYWGQSETMSSGITYWGQSETMTSGITSISKSPINSKTCYFLSGGPAILIDRMIIKYEWNSSLNNQGESCIRDVCQPQTPVFHLKENRSVQFSKPYHSYDLMICTLPFSFVWATVHIEPFTAANGLIVCVMIFHVFILFRKT